MGIKIPLDERQRWRLRTWRKRHHRVLRYIRAGLVAGGVVMVIAQLAYPQDRLLPFMRVGGKQIGAASVTEATKQLEQYYAHAKLHVQAGSRQTSGTLQEIGVDIEAAATARAAANYPLWQRIIPFSSVVKAWRQDTAAIARFDNERIAYFASEVQKQSFVPAKDAAVTVKDNKVVLSAAAPSQDYQASVVAVAIKRARFTGDTHVRVLPKTKPADRSDSEVRPLLGDAQTIINRTLKLVLPTETITVSKATVASWIDFPINESNNKRHAVVVTERVQGYASSIRNKVDRAPETVRVTIVDGRETGRSGKGAGQGLDVAATATLIGQVLAGSLSGTITVPVAQLPAETVYDRSYSDTQTGLATILADVASAKGGYGMAVTEIGGKGRSASANGSKKFVSASTYKLFVAYAVFKQIQAGQMGWSDSINGRTVDACFDAMIVRSDNPCAVAFGNKIGWSNIQEMMRGLGLTSTTTVAYGHTTTASDLALFLTKLENGTLLTTADRSKLLDAMRRQIYRAGIPAGTGVAVANKVGFIDGYLHDAGIVYAANHTYVLVILSKGSTWGNIADAAKQLHTYITRS